MISVACVIGVELAITQRLQLIILLSPFTAGLFILPLPLAAFCAGPIGGWLVPFIGFIQSNCVFNASFCNWPRSLSCVFDNAIWMSVVALAMTVQVLGGAMTAASAAVILNSPEHSSGAAASLESVAFEFGGTIGITLLGGLLNVIYSYDISSVPDLPFWLETALMAQLPLQNH